MFERVVPTAVITAIVAATAFFASALSAQTITVGKNVQVSKAHADLPQTENHLAVNPANPKQLLAAVMYFVPDRSEYSCTVYASWDGGATWQATLEVEPDALAGDPVVGFDVRGRAYAVVLAQTNRPDGMEETSTYVYHSTDAGKTWSKPTTLPFFDRQWIAVDNTGGPFAGRVYIHGNGGGHNMHLQNVESAKFEGGSMVLYHSTDGGVSFPEPLRVDFPDLYQPLQGNGVVLSDGTFLALIAEMYHGDGARAPSVRLRVIPSTDGGESVKPAITVSDLKWGSLGIPSMAADESTGPLRDRVYVTWVDQRSGHEQILLSYSTDKGQSWSAPLVVNDEPSSTAANKTPALDHPLVAVTKDGVVGLSWFDNREDSANIDWTPRFTTSLDGGETWTASVKISEAPYVHDLRKERYADVYVMGGGSHDRMARGGLLTMMMGPNRSYENGGDTEGLVADANGVFHALWVDNRTGVSQLWTTTITVSGRGVPNGSDELSQLQDLTADFALEISNPRFDPATQTITAQARLANTSPTTLTGPLKLRVIAIDRNKMGRVEIVDADLGGKGPGAVWDFTGVLSGGRVAPGARTGKRTITMRLTDQPTPWFRQAGGLGGFGALKLKVLGRR